MNITIPYKLTHGKELVVIPLEEYEELVNLRQVYEFKPSKEVKKALEKARRNRKKGQTLTLHELKNNLGLTN
ncbi:hypothetical protein HYT18_00375 [Candidatus Microgenomates bacterium]|nr:hypothetical protein [Candidatus Microgenomates bacterium]